MKINSKIFDKIKSSKSCLFCNVNIFKNIDFKNSFDIECKKCEIYYSKRQSVFDITIIKALSSILIFHPENQIWYHNKQLEYFDIENLSKEEIIKKVEIQMVFL